MNEKHLSIAHLVLSLDVGGLERLVIDLARQQCISGHQVQIYCLSHRGTMADQAELSGIPVCAFEKRRGFSPALVCSLASRLRADCVDVLHTHNAMVHHYGVAAAALAGVPAIVNTQHGHHDWDATKTDRRLKGLFRATLPWTGAVVMVSKAAKLHHVSKQAVPERKCQVIPNGLFVDRFASYHRRRGSRQRALRFGAVGRLAPIKDHMTMIEAFHRVVIESPAAELHIAGDGEERPRLAERIAALGLSSRVHLHGVVHDVPAFLGTLDVFVMSSLSEGLPIAVLEAMASGLPVVSTRVGGIPAVAPEGEVAYYCAPNDAEALAVQMLRMDHADLGAMGAAATATVRRNYGIGQTTVQYEQIYWKLLRRRALEAALPRSVLHD